MPLKLLLRFFANPKGIFGRYLIILALSGATNRKGPLDFFPPPLESRNRKEGQLTTGFTSEEKIHSTGEPAPERLWDVAIVGAGPAGATAAIHLARRGHRVLLLDRQDFPRDKVCGDALIPDAIRSLRRAGLYEKVCRVGFSPAGGTVYSPSRIQFDVYGEFLTIKRIVLDELIVERAREMGAEFLRGKVTDIQLKPDNTARLQIAGRDNAVACRIVLVATGANVKLLDKLGLVKRQAASGIALRCYVRSSFRLDRLVISYDRSITPGYAWIFPLAGNEFNIGCGVTYDKKPGPDVNLKEILLWFIKSFPLAAGILRDAEYVGPIRGAMLRCGLEGSLPLATGNLMVLGESIGSTFPFTGEGIGKAMETGEMAAEIADEALSSGDFSRLKEYPNRLDRELKPKFVSYQIAQSWLTRPWLNDFVAGRIKRSAFLQQTMSGIVNETVDPREIFSLRGILRSLVS